jgi:hypothetical protein
MDDTLPWTFLDFLQALFMTIGSVLFVAIIFPWVLIAILPVCCNLNAPAAPARPGINENS